MCKINSRITRKKKIPLRTVSFTAILPGNCASDVPSDFLSERINSIQAYSCTPRDLCFDPNSRFGETPAYGKKILCAMTENMWCRWRAKL